MILSILFLVLAVALWFRPHRSAVIFVFFAFMHDAIFGRADGWTYYISAGCFNLAVLLIVARACTPSRVSDGVLVVSFLALLSNFYGWVLWFCYLEPASYNLLFIGLYILTIFTILRGDDARDKGCSYFGLVSSLGFKGAMDFRLLRKKAAAK